MSPVNTDQDFSVLISQVKDGKTLYLYPVVRDIDVLLSTEEDGVDTLGDLLANGVTPSISSMKAIFVDSDDLKISFDEEAKTGSVSHKNLIPAGSTNGTNGNVEHGGDIKIPSFSVDKNGHITELGLATVTLPEGYTLPTASTEELGGIKIGNGFVIDKTGSASIKEATETEVGGVLLTNEYGEDLTNKAASGSSVYSALVAANEYADTGIKNLKESGISPDFNELVAIIAESNGISISVNDENKTITFGHKNTVEAGSSDGSNGELNYGDSIKIPSFTFDENGHITAVSTTEATLPEAYSLPIATHNTLGGVIIGDSISLDSETGKITLDVATLTSKGIVMLSNSTDSDEENIAATSFAVKTAYGNSKNYTDTAISELTNAFLNEFVSVSGGDVTGSLNLEKGLTISNDVSISYNTDNDEVSFS
jgi:hypothetical protein